MAPYIVTLIAVLFGCLVPFTQFALHGSDDDCWLVRAYQSLRLSRPRLTLMLQSLRVDPAAYRRNVPVVLLKRQIAACRACPSKAGAIAHWFAAEPASPDSVFVRTSARSSGSGKGCLLPRSAPLARA